MRPGSDRGAASSPRRDAITCAAALFGHAALLALAFGVELRSPLAPAPPDAIDETTVIELFAWAPAPRETPPLPAARSPEPGTASRDFAGNRGNGREALPDLPLPAQPDISPAPVTSPTAAPAVSGDAYAPAPAVPVAGNGLLGTPVWAVPGALPAGPDLPGSGTAAPQGPLAPKAAQAPGKLVLRDTMLSRDRELGLGNPGATAVANAVADAVRGSSIPAESSAVIVARIGGDGVVVSLGVQQFSSGNTRQWSGVAQAATAALGKKKLGLAGLGSRGAIVQVTVRSGVTLPSGAKSPVEGRIPSLTEGPPRDVMPAPSPDGDACAPERWSDLKPVCGVGAKIGTFDAADAVAGKHRSVKTSFRITLLDDALALVAPAPSTSVMPAPASAAPAAPSAPDAGAP